MGTFYLTLTAIALLLLSTNVAQAQTTQPKLNQVELSKKLIGNWKAELAKDTVIYYEVKAFGTTGLECYYKIVAKDKIFSEAKQIWGYDSKLDKYVGASLFIGKDIDIYAIWFTAENKSVDTNFADISNPDKASSKGEGEFKSPDAWSETDFVNGKPVMTYNFKRIK